MVIGENEAKLNITVAGFNGDLPDPVSRDASDEEVLRWGMEAVRTGGVPGIPAQPMATFTDFVVRRYDPTPDVPFTRLMIVPKTALG